MLIQYDQLYTENSHGEYVPKAIFADNDPSAISEFQNSKLGSRLDEHQILQGEYEGQGTYLYSHYHHSSVIAETLKESIRIEVERCDTTPTFILSNSLSGGTGCGVSSMALEHISSEYSKASRVGFMIPPDPYTSYSHTETYNFMSFLIRTMSIVF